MVYWEEDKSFMRIRNFTINDIVHKENGKVYTFPAKAISDDFGKELSFDILKGFYGNAISLAHDFQEDVKGLVKEAKEHIETMVEVATGKIVATRVVTDATSNAINVPLAMVTSNAINVTIAPITENVIQEVIGKVGEVIEGVKVSVAAIDIKVPTVTENVIQEVIGKVEIALEDIAEEVVEEVLQKGKAKNKKEA